MEPKMLDPVWSAGDMFIDGTGEMRTKWDLQCGQLEWTGGNCLHLPYCGIWTSCPGPGTHCKGPFFSFYLLIQSKHKDFYSWFEVIAPALEAYCTWMNEWIFVPKKKKNPFWKIPMSTYHFLQDKEFHFQFELHKKYFLIWEGWPSFSLEALNFHLFQW